MKTFLKLLIKKKYTCHNIYEIWAIMYYMRIILVLITLTIISCSNKKEVNKSIIKSDFKENPVNQLYGINLNSHIIKETIIRRGDTFGKILEENGIDYPEVHKILDIIKNKVDVKT